MEAEAETEVDEQVRTMVADTHRRVLCDPVVATGQLVSEYGDDLTFSDDVIALFGGIDELYAAAIEAPAEFERLLSARVNGVWTCTGVRNIRAWATLRFMSEWRMNPDAHNGRSRRFYKAFLRSELDALRREEVEKQLPPVSPATAGVAATLRLPVASLGA